MLEPHNNAVRLWAGCSSTSTVGNAFDVLFMAGLTAKKDNGLDPEQPAYDTFLCDKTVP